MDIPTRIRELKEARGLTSYRLSKTSGVSQTYLREIESGTKQPTVEIIEKLATALGLTLSEFFSEEPPELTADQREILALVDGLPPDQIASVKSILKGLKHLNPSGGD